MGAIVTFFEKKTRSRGNLRALVFYCCKAKLQAHLLVELQPCGETLCVLILESEVPNLPQANGLNNLEAQRRIEGC